MIAGGLIRPVVSVVIPAYNEEENVGEVLSRTRKAVKSSSLPFEVILIDDGSTDRTRDVAQGHNVIILRNRKNQGKGAALRKGFERARGDIIVTLDADGSHDPEDIQKLVLPVMNGSSVAVGSRFATVDGRRSTKNLHLLGNRLLNFSILLLTGKRITDSQSGFRAMKRSVVKEIKTTSAGYEMEAEFLVKALRNGHVVSEVPINATGRITGRSHVKPLTDGLKIMKMVIRSGILD